MASGDDGEGGTVRGEPAGRNGFHIGAAAGERFRDGCLRVCALTVVPSFSVMVGLIGPAAAAAARVSRAAAIMAERTQVSSDGFIRCTGVRVADRYRRSIAALRSRDLYEYAQYVAMYGMWRGLEWTRPYPGTRVRGDSVSMIIPSEALRKRRSLCARARVRSARDTVWKFSHSCAAVDNSQT